MARTDGVWTVSEAKARLSEVLRQAAEDGPQRIGVEKPFIVIPAETWDAMNPPDENPLPLGKWLLANMPRGEELPLPSRKDADRPIPFIEDAEAR